MNGKVKVAVITGGSKGIGYGIAKVLAESGYQVVVTSRDPGRAKEAARTIRSDIPVKGAVLDLHKRSTFSTMVDSILIEYGGIDVLINNAVSQSVGTSVLDTPDEAIESAITANITNVIILTRMFYSSLKTARGNRRRN